MNRLSRITLATCAGAAIVLATATEISAHDTWLFPKRTEVPVGGRVTLDLTSGMAFPRNAFSIELARIETAMVRLAGSTFTMKRRTLVKGAMRLEAVLPQRGVAAIWITLKPRTLELTPSQVQEYIQEIGATDSIRKLYPAGGKSLRWREQYTKEAKSFVAVGPANPDTSWKIPVGMSFEIVPLSDPRTITSGDTVVFRVLRSGRALSGFPIGDVGERKPLPRLSSTDANGILRLTAPAAGRWMLRGTDLRRPPATIDADWQSVFTTLTLNVRARTKH